MSIVQNTKRKPTAADHIEAEHPKRVKMTEDDLIAEHGELQSASNNAQAVVTADPKMTHPWLTRQQNISEQDLWVIYCRDNLVPGSTGAKGWNDVTAEYNEHFKDELKKGLSFKTLQKRMGVAKKRFYADNPDYVQALVYPVPISDGQNPEGNVIEDNVTQSESVLTPVEALTPQKDRIRPGNKATNTMQAQQPLGPKQHAGSSSIGTVADFDSQYGHVGAYSASSVSAHHISAIDRAKYHLRRRGKDRVTFNFLDDREQTLMENDQQFIEHETMLMISPFYARLIRSNSVGIVDVPVDFCAKTVNAFTQMISPVCAKTLPTHYLWHLEKPVPGVYDRFGAIKPEKIHWSVSYLLELLAFARHMEVWFVCDIVIDRLHWMFSEQAKHRELYGKLQKQGDWIGAQGENKSVRLPPVSDLDSFSIAAADVEPAWLRLLTEEPIHMQSLTFFRDLTHALGGALDPEWLEDAPQLVQNLFEQVGVQDCLTNASRAEFCAHYHHHTDGQPCYATAVEQSPEYFVELLYATTSNEELLTPSKHAGSPNSVHGMTYSAACLTQDLVSAESSSEMIEIEKLVLRQEMQLDLAKAALLKARKAWPEEKDRTIRFARQMAEGL